jgi:hypothetical protein
MKHANEIAAQMMPKRASFAATGGEKKIALCQIISEQKTATAAAAGGRGIGRNTQATVIATAAMPDSDARTLDQFLARWLRRGKALPHEEQT